MSRTVLEELDMLPDSTGGTCYSRDPNIVLSEIEYFQIKFALPEKSATGTRTTKRVRLTQQ